MSVDLAQRASQSLGEGAHATGSASFSQKLLQTEKQSPREGKFQSTPCVYLGRRMSVQSKLVGQDSKDQPPSSVSAMPA